MIKDLTQGKPESVLLRFSLPMFISVIFQQMYNMADSVIAGRFAGENALAAVGASYPITMIFMAIAVGTGIGCSVVISQLFGAKQMARMKTAVSTTLIMSVIASAVLTVVGLVISTPLMKMINTPDNIFSDAALYLNIYIGGIIFLFLYNVSTGIFNSLGDSKTPLYFLIGSSLGNVFLDWLFVAVYHWDVAGVAWATFIAQGVACVLAFVTLLRRVHHIKTEKYDKFSFQMVGQISRIAVPSILQQSFISIGNMMIQGIVNGYGSSVIAGYSAAIKLNTFAITSFTTLANGVSSFTAQNMGAKLYDRVKKGFKGGLTMAISIGLPFMAVYLIFSKTLLGAFMPSDSVKAIEVGQTFLRIVTPFYVVIIFKLIADGILRGSGAMREFTSSTFTDLILRVVLAYVLSHFFGTTGIWLSWPIGWSVATAMSMYFYKTEKWKGTGTEL